MNYKLAEMAFEIETESSSELLTLLALAKFANKEGNCFPSYDVLAKATKLSKRTIISVINKLSKKGLIQTTARYFKDTKIRSSNFIQLCYEKFSPKPLFLGSEMVAPCGEINRQTQCNEAQGVVQQLHHNIDNNKYIDEVIHTPHAQASADDAPIGGVGETAISNQLINQPQIEYLVSDEDKNKPVQSNPPLKDNYQFNWKTDLEKINLIKSELMDLAVKENEAEIFAKRLIQSNKFKRAFRTELDKLISNIKQGAMNYQVSATRIVEQANLKNWHSYEAHWGVYQEQKKNNSKITTASERASGNGMDYLELLKSKMIGAPVDAQPVVNDYTANFSTAGASV